MVESDLGLFAAQRSAIRAKQRAININTNAARLLLAPSLFKRGEALLNCTCVFGENIQTQERLLRKTHKNWRLGGPKIEGLGFSDLDSKDFMLLRSIAGNDGTHPVVMTLICRKTDRVVHAGLAAIVERRLKGSMAVFKEDDENFEALAVHCPQRAPSGLTTGSRVKRRTIPPMPRRSSAKPSAPRTVAEKIRTPHILQRMLKVAADLSAPAQVNFLRTIGSLGDQLRTVLLKTNGITHIDRDQRGFWKEISGNRIGFVDGGLANLSMLGSVPIAARVGGYSVVPGRRGENRETFDVLKHLIDELYSSREGGVYDDTFPDVGALRDAARIAIEAAGAVQMLSKHKDLHTLLLHGALVNPVSRYSDVMRDGRIRHRFPDFSAKALSTMLPGTRRSRKSGGHNFISVHLRQLELLRDGRPTVCGVIERESSTTSVCRAVLGSLRDDDIRDLLPEPPASWKRNFLEMIDPAADDDIEGPRITDPLLFRCVLEPGEALRPVELDRNELRRAPNAWRTTIERYPKPWVSYLQVNEWASPIRLELFRRDVERFDDAARLVLHCALLLPKYAFPVGLDVVDKFARIPDWLSRPVNTTTAVRAMKIALDEDDMTLFSQLRAILCGSGRDFLLRPGIFR